MYPTVMCITPLDTSKSLDVLYLRAYFYYSNITGPIWKIGLKEKCSKNNTRRSPFSDEHSLNGGELKLVSDGLNMW